MSILAEEKRKVRIGPDPQNIGWKNDEDKFGKKLMEKMGWSEGKGLGRNLHGDNSNIKLRPNRAGKGLGATAKDDSNWIAAHDDFADILKSLNKSKKEEKVDETAEEREARLKKMNMELTSKSIKRRIHYQKFTRAKDCKQYSEKEKEAIFGKTKEEPKVEEKEEQAKSDGVKEEVEEEGESTRAKLFTTQAVSVKDYFAAKMAALKAKQQGGETPVKKEEPDEVEEETEEQRRKREKKERKRREREAQEKQEEVNGEDSQPAAEEVEETAEERAQRKKEKKERKRREREAAAAVKEEPVDEEPSAKRACMDFAPPDCYENEEKEKPKKTKKVKKNE